MNNRLNLMEMPSSKMFQIIEMFDEEALMTVFGGIKEFAKFTSKLANRKDDEPITESNANDVKLYINREATSLTETISFSVRHNAEWRLIADVTFVNIAGMDTFAVIDINNDYKEGKIVGSDCDENGFDICSYSRHTVTINIEKTIKFLDWFKNYSKTDSNLLELKAIIKEIGTRSTKEWRF